MPPRFLADENLNGKIIAGLHRREPYIDFQTAKAAGILGLSDYEVLTIAASGVGYWFRTIEKPCLLTLVVSS